MSDTAAMFDGFEGYEVIGEFDFHIGTTGPIPAGLLARFIIDLENFARREDQFGPDVIVDLVDLRSGSKNGFVRLLKKIGSAGGYVADGMGIVAFVTAVATNPGSCGKSIEDLVNNPNVAEFTISCKGQTYVVNKANAAPGEADDAYGETALMVGTLSLDGHGKLRMIAQDGRSYEATFATDTLEARVAPFMNASIIYQVRFAPTGEKLLVVDIGQKPY